MSRIRRSSPRMFMGAVVAVAAAAMVVSVSGCGTTANTTAATVDGSTVSMETVQALASEASALGFAVSDVDPDSASVPGDDFRSVLMFAIQREAWLAEADRWGLDIDAGRSAASARLDEVFAQAPTQPSDEVRELLVDFFAAQTVVAQRFAEIDPGDDAVLRRLYDGVPSFWRRRCIAVLVVAPEDSAAAQDLIDGGAAIDEVPEQIDQSGLAADPSQGCLPELQTIPDEIQHALDSVPTGRTTGPIDSVGGTTPVVYFARFDGVERVGFDDARPDLERLAQSVASQQEGAGPAMYVDLLVQSATIDPRFGTGVVGQQGQSGTTFAITPPPAPQLAAFDLAPQPTGS